jgi:hypothetical protein
MRALGFDVLEEQVYIASALKMERRISAKPEYDRLPTDKVVLEVAMNGTYLPFLLTPVLMGIVAIGHIFGAGMRHLSVLARFFAILCFIQSILVVFVNKMGLESLLRQFCPDVVHPQTTLVFWLSMANYLLLWAVAASIRKRTT